jgi:hypothetical protein
LIDLKKYDLKLFTDWTFDSDFHCRDFGCEEEKICRCSTISHYEITSVGFNSIVSDIYKRIFEDSTESKRNQKIEAIIGGITDEINLYTIDRIFRINKLFLCQNFYAEIIKGYYGEEIGPIYINESVAEKVKNQLEVAFSKDNLTDRIKYLLYLEYGYILPDLKTGNFTLEIVKKNDIIFGNNSHFEKVSRENLEFYNNKNYKLIRGVAIREGERFRLIDGYHRCFSCNDGELVLLVLS